MCPVNNPETERFRNECEARYVLELPFEERKPWLDSIGRVRGIEAQRYLEEEVKRQHKLRQAA